VNSTLKNMLFWMVLVVVGVLVWTFSTRFQTRDEAISFSQFMTQVETGQVANVTITGNEITGTSKTNDTFRTHAPTQYEGLANRLIDKGVIVQAKDPTTSPWATLLYSWAPILLLTVAVTLLNPNGLRGATYPFTVWTNYGFDVIENYSILRIEKTVYASYYRLMELTLAALFVSFIVAARRSKRFPLPTFALALLIGGMAWWAVRAEPLLALFSLSAIAINIGPVSVRWPVAMAALGLVILAGLSYNGWRSLRKSAPIGLGLKPGSNLAAELLRDSGLDGPILNNFNIGGYLIYYLFPQHRVFMDSRPEAYSAAFIREKYQMPFENEDQWNQLLDEYKFNVICFARATTAENRFIRRRVADPAWAPVFYDGGIVILVRRTPSNSSFIQAHIIPQALLPSMTQ